MKPKTIIPIELKKYSVTPNEAIKPPEDKTWLQEQQELMMEKFIQNKKHEAELIRDRYIYHINKIFKINENN